MLHNISVTSRSTETGAQACGKCQCYLVRLIIIKCISKWSHSRFSVLCCNPPVPQLNAIIWIVCLLVFPPTNIIGLPITLVDSISTIVGLLVTDCHFWSSTYFQFPLSIDILNSPLPSVQLFCKLMMFPDYLNKTIQTFIWSSNSCQIWLSPLCSVNMIN